MIKRIRELLAKSAEQPEGLDPGIGNDDSLVDLGVIDSFGMIDFVADLQADFAIALEPDDLTRDNFDTVRAIAALVAKKTGSA